MPTGFRSNHSLGLRTGNVLCAYSPPAPTVDPVEGVAWLDPYQCDDSDVNHDLPPTRAICPLTLVASVSLQALSSTRIDRLGVTAYGLYRTDDPRIVPPASGPAAHGATSRMQSLSHLHLWCCDGSPVEMITQLRKAD